MKSNSENTDIFADQKNKNKNMNSSVAENSGSVVQSSLTGKNNYKDKHNCTQIMSGNGSKNIGKNKVVLVKNDDEYDLKLRFKPRHKQHIVNAKNNQTSNYGISKPKVI